jgi:hypothetical protein
MQRVQHVVVVVPVGREVDEAEHIGEEDGQHLRERRPVRAVRDLQFTLDVFSFLDYIPITCPEGRFLGVPSKRNRCGACE